eukprot:2796323-Rhodomonas_salina.1
MSQRHTKPLTPATSERKSAEGLELPDGDCLISPQKRERFTGMVMTRRRTNRAVLLPSSIPPHRPAACRLHQTCTAFITPCFKLRNRRHAATEMGTERST